MSSISEHFDSSLRLKLSTLENAAARIASVKSALKENVESIRGQVADLVSQQLAQIRAREQQLLTSLDKIVAEKEQRLARQQEVINQSIGACQQSITTMEQREVSGTCISQFKYGTIDLSPCETANIVLEADTAGMMVFLANYGKVVTKNVDNKAETSLPSEFDEYEEISPLVHKSVMLPSSRSTPQNLRDDVVRLPGVPASLTVHNWLMEYPRTQNMLDADVESLVKHYEAATNKVRQRLNSCDGSNASFEVVASNPAVCEFSLNGAMEEVLKIPRDRWLLRHQRPKEDDILKPQETSKRARVVLEENSNSTPHFEFEDVILSILRSDSSQWLMKSTACQTEAQISAVSSSTPSPTPSTQAAQQGVQRLSTSCTYSIPPLFTPNDPTPALTQKLQSVNLNKNVMDDAQYEDKLYERFNMSRRQEPMTNQSANPLFQRLRKP